MERLNRLPAFGTVTLACLVVSMPGLGCAAPGGRTAATGSTDEDERAVREFTGRYAESFSGGDAERVVALMTEDFVALSPGKPPIIGKDATRREVVCDLADLEIQSLQFEPAEIAVHGNWAWTWGRSQVVMRAKGDADFITVDGKYLWILRRQADGTWLIARDSAQAD